MQGFFLRFSLKVPLSCTGGDGWGSGLCCGSGLLVDGVEEPLCELPQLGGGRLALLLQTHVVLPQVLHLLLKDGLVLLLLLSQRATETHEHIHIHSEHTQTQYTHRYNRPVSKNCRDLSCTVRKGWVTRFTGKRTNRQQSFRDVNTGS